MASKDILRLPMLLLVLSQVSYHCKHGYDYGSPDPVDILPSSCSGLCLAAITNLAFVVLSYLSPMPPDTPAIKQHKGQTEAEPSTIPAATCSHMAGFSLFQRPATSWSSRQRSAAGLVTAWLTS
jgi:hypothetical protein